MADALCGPSNPLQNFQKHTQQDRTLQQDRLVSRPGASSSSFRSHDPTTGFLDPEFEAFQAGQHVPPTAAPVPPSALLQPFRPPLAARPAPSAAPDWALDFQRLNLSSPAAAQSIRQSKSPVTATPATSITTRTAYQPQFQPSLQYNQMNSMYGTPVGMGFDMDMDMQAAQQHEAPMMSQQETSFDAAAFEKAFDAATLDWMESERELDELMSGATRGGLDGQEQATFEINKTRLDESIVSPEPIFQDGQKPARDVLDPQEEADALARTAGQLLESVSHDTSDKFAQSSFLSLMRRLRDRELKVDGENIVDTSTNEVANTTGEATKEATDTPRIPPLEQDTDLGRLAPSIQEKDFGVSRVSRPLTPEIDPPAPSLEDWRQRLLG